MVANRFVSDHFSHFLSLGQSYHLFFTVSLLLVHTIKGPKGHSKYRVSVRDCFKGGEKDEASNAFYEDV